VSPVLEVVAGVLYDEDGRVLITQRPMGKVLAGRWEFPGGKLMPNEDPYAGLVRELREELAVDAHAAERMIRYSHSYPDRVVRLDVWRVTDWSGQPVGLEGQALKWVHAADLPHEDILEADAPVVQRLALAR
jgi:8-oxo-dGTP diphosphatase